MIKTLLATASAAILMLTSASAADVFTQEGKCELKESSGFSNSDAVEVKFGKAIKATAKLYLDDFFDKKIINANISVENTADKPMHCQYYVAFFDSDGTLIGCASQGSFSDEGIKAGASTNFGSCLIPLPKGFHEKAVTYKITFYEGETIIGKD
ncbi:hypothetical protein [Sulfuriroseicoccus oceanibius]|uniref:Uncharacterized protein n=1 Tax=Sulfuriroseicoccus oceanibius TaxID=2707525 RepID=A0A6B3L4T9_9BACT|nr:hypothetical protein [Sulfuriroseicoccus oceanibius]QQL43825.1 hypothetical protein G3M56_007930 [Sulfuriroseicoccus oceanibius]